MGKRMAVIDVFKLEKGMLAEHWDVIQELPDENGLQITATNGTAEVDEAVSAQESKLVVSRFYGAVIAGEDANEFISHDYIEHNPAIIASGRGLGCYLLSGSVIIHQLIAEGNFVTVRFEFRRDDNAFSVFGIFRIEDGKIAEHWSVEQAI